MKPAIAFPDIAFVFVDVGASGEMPPRFHNLESIAELVRFDPDIRALKDVTNSYGKRIVTINKVVTESDDTSIDFFLTQSPYCSSSLRPDQKKLDQYEYGDLFHVQAIVKVPAVKLDEALSNVGVERIDWINLDTQGTELRILESLPQAIFDRLLAVDVESSLYAHYMSADTLPSIHQRMVMEGFWIAEMRPHLRTRMTKKTGEALRRRYRHPRMKNLFDATLHRAPTSLECLYLRTLESAIQKGYRGDELARLAVAYLAAEIPEYAYQVVQRLKESAFESETTKKLEHAIDRAFKERMLKHRLRFIMEWAARKIARVFGK